MSLAVSALRHRFARLPGSLRGISWMIASVFFYTVMGVAVKFAGHRLDPMQIGFARALFGLLAMLPFAYAAGWAALKTSRPMLQFFRGFTGSTAMLIGFWSIVHLPLAEVTAVSFANPLFLLVLAVLFLGEKVRARRWSATAVGFIGVLIMVRPGLDMNPAMLIALGGTALVAISVILIKTMAKNDNPMTLLLYFGIFSTAISAIPAALVWQDPTWEETAFLVVTGACGTAAQSCYIRAFAAADASLVAPFEYTKLIFAGLFGFVFFLEVPDGWTILGAAIIVASTLYIARREAQLGRHAPRAPAKIDPPGALPPG
ncbi:DMT family transporter [Oleomonas cavernae]|uniref:DMT family transporter n=1 Tax=Oleomonas cavernae TaxID=2320859 RepID=A0A418WEV0_9PROT|nr:DMT family transporter [Oleomonas cavernae]RJF88524.1 DMT family transporter [Oleomonas cavernae]